MKNAKIILLAALSVLLVSGCQAPRGLQHEVSEPQLVVDGQQSEVVQLFAQTLARMSIGSVEIFEETPFGVAQISKVREYVNGLGESCYLFTITTEVDRRNAAVCRTYDKQLRYVEFVH